MSWTDINCHAVWKFADFNNMRDHLLQQRQPYISVLFWLALLPDLSPIEHLWDELVIRVHHRQNPPEALHE
jgi:hypothetical protein